MKKIFFSLFTVLVASFLLSGFPFSSASAGGNQNGESVSGGASDQKDFELAQVIRRLTNRTTEDLTEFPAIGGGFGLDLDDRFQNVMLSRIDTDGEPIAACVTDIGEADRFFGRDLETGAPVPQTDYQIDKTASRHGMSVAEYEYFQKMIVEATQKRADNPSLATLNIINNDGAGEGFNDPAAFTPEGGNSGTTLGQARLNLFNQAAQIWGAFLDTTVPIDINAQFNPLSPCSTSGGVLGSAGTTQIYRDFTGAEFPATWYSVALANKRSGADQYTGAEINATFNSSVDTGCLGTGTRFYYGLDNSTPSGRINLLIVLLHEMGHGLGFQSFASGTTGALNGGFSDVYTRQMFDRTTNKYWAEMTNAERQASALNSGNVLWDGANVKIASGFLASGRDAAGRVQLYTPTTFQSGSSVSHFDTANAPNLLMEPAINIGIPLTLDLTRQQMRDIGWYRDTNGDRIPDTITNVQPSGNAVQIGSNVAISWTNTGGFNRNVTVELSTDGGATYSTLAGDISNTGSFIFAVPNQPTSQARIRVREVGFVAPAGVSVANFAISSNPVVNTRKQFDFDGDGKADISVFRSSNSIWYIQQSSAGFTGVSFGQTGDKVVPADYDGDGKTDVAVFRGGVWYLQRSSAGFAGITFGAAADIPVPADFDGDGKAELAVFRPSNGGWYLYNLATGGTSSYAFGANGDRPLPADYDGDGKADYAVFRSGTWYIQRSSLGFTGVSFGTATDLATPADFDGDGKTDIAVFRPLTGIWYIQGSQSGFTGVSFGQNGDQPTAADYDGDGKADIAIFRSGVWYLQRTSAGFTGISFGAGTDQPIPNAFVQ